MTGAPTTAVVAALPEELTGLVPRLEARGRRRLGARTLWLGRLAGTPVALYATGDGAANARRGIAELLGALPVERLIVVGVAGALTPELAAGDVVASHRVERAGEAPLEAAADLLDAAESRGARPGTVVTTGRLADTPQAKATLAGGAAGPAVVDLESHHYAAAAAEAGVAWLVLRAVSDTAAEGLPAFLESCRDEGGAVRRGRVVRCLLRHPGALPQLLLLRRRVGRCAGILARCVEEILRGAPGSPDPEPEANR